ncbi:MAG: SMC-Scp complex subunit ScpB [Oscillospiraceae bacterium]|jgi:segregation and condensation protein B|nr:SMC-Scp complex subunit ScpB [Oscillospiraceae bacterium]
MDRTIKQLTFPHQPKVAPLRMGRGAQPLLVQGGEAEPSAIETAQFDIALVMEAVLFASGEPLSVSETAKALGVTKAALEAALHDLQSEYDEGDRGIRLLLYGDSAQFTTRETYASAVMALLRPVQKQPLSQAVLETLAIIAYKQPATRAEIDQLRGVKSDASVHALLSKGLIRELGRRETLGRPMEFGTTDAFLRHFGLSALSELTASSSRSPTLDE